MEWLLYDKDLGYERVKIVLCGVCITSAVVKIVHNL